MTMGFGVINTVMMSGQEKPSRVHIVAMLLLLGLMNLWAIFLLITIDNKSLNRWGVVSLTIITFELIVVDFLKVCAYYVALKKEVRSILTPGPI